MAAPTVTMYVNTGTEGTPTWTEIVAADVIKFTGPDTDMDPTEIWDPVTAPGTGTKVGEEMWIDDDSAVGAPWGFQCATYDGTVNTNQNVFRIYFATNPTSTAPILTAYDSTSHGATPTKEICTGTAGTSNTGFIKAIETTGGAPGGGWCTATTSNPSGNTTNELNGDDNYVECAAAASADSEKLFNIVCYVPSDAGAGTTGHDPVISCKYTYT